MASALIGTSGWAYASWKGRFYPAGLPSGQQLGFYAKEFPTTEVNYSFYHLPRPETYAKWAAQAPKGFVFSVKASRLITHNRRLLHVEEAWQAFLRNALTLGPCLGPVLFQFPESFQCDLRRLNDFLDLVRHDAAGGTDIRLVFEFRHTSWFVPEIYALLRRRQAALCIADSPRYPRHHVLTCDFVYFRFHGKQQLFASSYSREELEREARYIQEYLQQGVEVYAYFNNDAKGYAVDNARLLTTLTGSADALGR